MRWIAIAVAMCGCGGGKASDGASCDAVAAKMISFMHRDADPDTVAAFAGLDAVAKPIFIDQCADFEAAQRSVAAATSEAGMFACLGAPRASLTCPAGANHVGPV